MKLPSTYDITKWMIISALIALMTACGASKHVTQVVHDTRVDTVYLNSKQYDSIYIYRELDKDYHKGAFNPSALTSHSSPDTVFLKDKSIEYRYKLLRDTIKVVQRDSIPYEVTITEIKEVPRPKTWFDRLCRYAFFLLCGALLFFVYRCIRKFI